MSADALRRLWRLISPHHRRVAAKRRLERLLREKGIPRKLAATITETYFQKGNP